MRQRKLVSNFELPLTSQIHGKRIFHDNSVDNIPVSHENSGSLLLNYGLNSRPLTSNINKSHNWYKNLIVRVSTQKQKMKFQPVVENSFKK